jgi:malic enzyme
MGISVGKTYLYSVAGGFHPKHVLPVVLDVGCADEELRSSDAYVGAPIARATGAEYDSFVGEFHAACQVRVSTRQHISCLKGGRVDW